MWLGIIVFMWAIGLLWAIDLQHNRVTIFRTICDGLMYFAAAGCGYLGTVYIGKLK
jgi:hypothetical protein